RRCTDATRGFSGRLWDWAFSNPVKRTATTTAAAPTTTAATGLAPEAVMACESRKQRRPARTGATEVGMTPLHGASIRIAGAGTATAAIMHHAGDPSRGPVSEFGTTVQPLNRRQTIATFEMGRSNPCIKQPCRGNRKWRILVQARNDLWHHEVESEAGRKT